MLWLRQPIYLLRSRCADKTKPRIIEFPCWNDYGLAQCIHSSRRPLVASRDRYMFGNVCLSIGVLSVVSDLQMPCGSTRDYKKVEKQDAADSSLMSKLREGLCL
jgi:hypothetical protein